MAAVLYMHITDRLSSVVQLDLVNFMSANSHNGGKAVDGFFIISGFCYL